MVFTTFFLSRDMHSRKIKQAIHNIIGKFEFSPRNLKDHISVDRIDRLSFLLIVLGIMSGFIILRLFALQVIEYPFYSALASNQHEIQAILDADRGDIIAYDHSQPGQEFHLATDKEYVQVYSVPNQIEDPELVAETLAPYVSKSEEDLLFAFSKEGDPYEPVEKKVSLERFEAIKALELPGIHGLSETDRYYIDDNVGSHVLGFLGNVDDKPKGLYGIEGYFDSVLSGVAGSFQTERDVAGRWIVLSDKKIEEAVDGGDIVLTIDRTLQFMVCESLNNAIQRHGAKGGAVIVMDPSTGKIMAMCSGPDFNPNYYSDVDSADEYNNKAIFEAYEVGSIFKPVIMSAAFDLELVTPESTFKDPGSYTIDEYTIRNADDKVYGEETMASILENSINTGMIYVERLLGPDRFRDYLERYGFGEITGIELQTEVAGNISSIYKSSEIYQATASFGQGITATPLQMVSAYATIANGGNLMRPYIVEEIRHADGNIEKRKPEVIRQVLSPRAATLMNGMLTSVVSNGHAAGAQVDGYYVAGKTGTAQIASGGGYREDATNHSFVGYAPADDPKFVMIVRLDRPSSALYSASTAAPVFAEIAKYILQYYQVQPDF